MCIRFESTKEEVGESCSNLELVESKENKAFTSGKKNEESIHEEQEKNHLCLMGHEQEVSNSSSSMNECSYDELQDAFNELYGEFEKVILKNKVLKKQISTLSKSNSNEDICKKCDDLEKENKILKEEISDFNMERDCFINKNSSLNQENVSLKEKVLLLENENETLKEKFVLFEKENSLLKKKNLDFEKNNTQKISLKSKKDYFQEG